MTNINQKTFHILCVDDSSTNLHLLNSVLNKHGYKVTCIDDGREALDYVNHHSTC